MRLFPVLALGLVACITEEDDRSPVLDFDEVPNFLLDDIANDQTDVSPSDFSSHVSAYYFGHST